VVKALEDRRIIVFDESEERGAAITQTLERRGASVVLVGRDPPGRTTAEVAARFAEATARIGAITDLVVAQAAPPWTGRSPLRFEAAFQDDGFWRESIAAGVDVPWRWLCAALQAMGGGTIMILLPMHGPVTDEAPDDAAAREGMIAFMRIAADQAGMTGIRVNAAQIAAKTAAATVARTIAGLMTASMNGEVVTVQAAR